METVDLIDDELIRVRDSLKGMSKEELEELEGEPMKREYVIFGKTYPLTAWS